ncbi:condensation domain-containing protein [Actinomadura rubrisoli]|uniref:Carrier domain-containing protein n=1 Tax=Actinomadura rubrisoli TaxID=2530368 RepID=A0A4R5BA46_9ACTN|nr:condensation domain-containing protein [Actinomadura rubrisoli]TDD80584.1 hypothetical protein E1298_25575 [Actinomadura rubrisoli]
MTLSSGGLQPTEHSLHQRVQALWRRTLHVPEARPDDDFFGAGGHSLAAVHLAAGIAEAASVEVTFQDIVENPRLGQLLGLLERRGAGRPRPAPPTPVTDNGGLSLVQEARFARATRWHDGEPPPHENYVTLVRLQGALDHAVLARALEIVVARHPILLSRFARRDGRTVRWTATDDGSPLEIADGTVRAQLRRRLDVTGGPVSRTVLLPRGRDRHLLVWLTHAIVHDGWWSRRILLRELASVHRDLALGRTPVPRPADTAFTDFAGRQRARLTGERLDALLDFWDARLDGLGPVPPFGPKAPSRPVPPSGPEAPSRTEAPSRPVPPSRTETGSPAAPRGRRLTARLDAETTRSLRSACVREGTTLFAVGLCALRVLLHAYSGARKVGVLAPVANRVVPGSQDSVGPYAHLAVFAGTVRPEETLRESLAGTLRDVAETLDHAEIPHDELLARSMPGAGAGPWPERTLVFTARTSALRPLDLGPVTGTLLEPPPPAMENLSLVLSDEGTTVRLSAEYDAAWLPAPAVRGLLTDLAGVLTAVAVEPESGVGRQAEAVAQGSGWLRWR